MNLLHTLLAFIAALGALVVVHELGHFWVARMCGVKVLRFSVGMGRIVFSRRFGKDQTEWALSILPLGGYVKLLDAREQDLQSISEGDLAREFMRQNVWKRMAIVSAGPIANFILAILLFAGLYMYGIPEPVTRLRSMPEQSAAFQAGLRGGELVTAVNGEAVHTWSDLRWKLIQAAVEKKPMRLDVQRPNSGPSGGNILDTVTLTISSLSDQELEGDFLGKLGISVARPKAVLGTIAENGPAMAAGLLSGDLILTVNGKSVTDGLALVDVIRASPAKPLTLHGLRGGQRGKEFDLVVTPEAHTEGAQLVGKIKVEVALAPEMVVVSDPPVTAVGKAVMKTWDTSALTIKMLGKMLIGEASWKNITGPITIADYAGQTARIGVVSYLSFIALISISLGVMNLLPIPVLDGGLLLYYSLEVLTGRPVSERFGEIAQRAGLGILLLLMMIAIFNDIIRLIS